MPLRHLPELILLAALWGGSFLLMRVAVPQFGPLALIALRVLIAAAVLLPVLTLGQRWRLLRPHAGALLVVDVVNSALPFCLVAYALLSLTAGFGAILNATSPLWGALVARVWLGEHLTPPRLAGLALGFAGVAVLVWGQASLQPGGSGWGLLAGLAAALSYGVAANYARRRLAGVDPLAVAAGSQLGASLVLAPLALWAWPATPVTGNAWLSVLALGAACTGLAYVLYFRLIASVGPARAISVTFLVPLFAVLWGALWLREPLSGQMLVGASVVLAGTALATGALRGQRS